MQPWIAPTPSDPSRIDAVVEVPGSKSETNRALVLAALAEGPSLITGGLHSRDSDLMRAALAALEVTITDTAHGWQVTPPASFTAPAAPIDCGLAGTVMRFVPPLAALTGGAVTFVGDAHASQRPMAPLCDALRQLGVSVSADALPLTVCGPLTGNQAAIDSSASSQFISALLLVGARLPHGLTLRHVGDNAAASVPSRPHIDMTVAMLRERGMAVECPDAATWRVAPGPVAARDTRIEPDLTNAAVFLAAAALGGGRVRVPGWPAQTTQGGQQIVDLLRTVGAEVTLDDNGLSVRGARTAALGRVDLHAASELTPVVAAMAALLEGETTITGVAHIRGHETDRLAALAAELSRVGSDVGETDDGLHIVGRGPSSLHGDTWQTYADHRMAHAGALIGLFVDGVTLDDIECTTKTMADFAGLWQGMLHSASVDRAGVGA